LIGTTPGFDKTHGAIAVIGAGVREANNCVVTFPGKQILKFPIMTLASTEPLTRIAAKKK